jgi:hypothetical protein
LSTTNPIWPDPGSNPGRRGGKPATNRLSCGAAPNTTVACNRRRVLIEEMERKLLQIWIEERAQKRLRWSFVTSRLRRCKSMENWCLT